MCGICGELRFDGSPADTLAVARMSDKIARRGPDHSGAFGDGPLALGHRRLTFIDLSADGDQPMVDKELEQALVFNSTIYNYKELRAELVTMGYQHWVDVFERTKAAARSSDKALAPGLARPPEG